jgi:hypothetical protein
MKKLAILAGPMVLTALAVHSGLAGAQDDTTPSIKVVMKKLHGGASSPLAKLKTALKAENPNWETVRKSTKDFVILGAALAKNDPPKGDKASWKSLSEDYFNEAKKLDDAAEAHDKTAAQAAFKKLAASCKACHGAHKGK